MRTLTISLIGLFALSDCVSLHAEVPDEVIRHHIARKEGIEIGAICSHESRHYSERAVACRASQRMTCSTAGRCVSLGEC
jgi:hypothetical protein